MDSRLQVYSPKEVSEILKCSEAIAKSVIRKLPHCQVGDKFTKQPMLRIAHHVLEKYINGELSLQGEEVQVDIPKTRRVQASRDVARVVAYRK